MDLQTSFGVLSEVIEQYESCGRSVRDVEATAADGVLSVDLDVSLDLCPGGRGSTLTPEAAELTDQGGVRVAFAPPDLPELPPETASVVTVESREVAIDGDEPVLTVGLAIEPTDDRRVEHGGENDPTDTAVPADDHPGDTSDTDAEPAGGEATTELGRVRDDSVPPYDDTPYLRRLYETSETFAEMSRRIEMDVSSETVRRYMIEAGVHDPTPYDTDAGTEEPADETTDEDQQSTAGEPEDSAATASSGARTGAGTDDDAATSERAVRDGSSPVESASEESTALPDEQLVTDGIGLPANLRVEAVADAVVGSATLYEVHQRLDIDRESTRQLLQELNLLDLVMGRLATASEQEVTEELVAARLRERAGGD